MEDLADLEALVRVYGVDEDVAVDVDGVLGRHDGVLVLARGVHQVQLVVVAAHVHALVEG